MHLDGVVKSANHLKFGLLINVNSMIMKTWALSLFVTAISMASAPALAADVWDLSHTKWNGKSMGVKCSYVKAGGGNALITVHGGWVQNNNKRQTCLAAHGASQTGEYLRRQPAAEFRD